jgi:type I restriction enzyme S subunit
VRSKDVQPNHLAKTDETRSIAAWFARKNASKTVRAMDLLTQRTGEYSGVTAVVPRDLDGSQCFTMLITTPSPELNPYFASLFINSRAGSEYFDQTRWGTAQPNISVPILQNMPITVPPREEQDAIVASALSADERHARIVEKVQQQIERLREYRQALITAAVAGKLDATKEPA